MQLGLLYSTTKRRASEPIPWRGIFVTAALLWEQTTTEQVPHFHVHDNPIYQRFCSTFFCQKL